MDILLSLSEISALPKPDEHEYKVMQCEWYNQNKGNLRYINCPECKNKGFIAQLDSNDVMRLSECSCMVMRRNFERIDSSGLQRVTEHLTFEAFEASEEWQKSAKSRAIDYLNHSDKKWLYIGGQSGCGKTHLCTAVCIELIQKGREVRYVVWQNLFHELQGLQFKEEEYKNKLREYREIDVLYIDDFLKMFDARSRGAELNFAFEVINARYISGKTTVISSELHIDRLAILDRAIAGRIAEKSSGYLIQIKYVKGRNYRMKGVE